MFSEEIPAEKDNRERLKIGEGREDDRRQSFKGEDGAIECNKAGEEAEAEKPQPCVTRVAEHFMPAGEQKGDKAEAGHQLLIEGAIQCGGCSFRTVADDKAAVGNAGGDAEEQASAEATMEREVELEFQQHGKAEDGKADEYKVDTSQLLSHEKVGEDGRDGGAKKEQDDGVGHRGELQCHEVGGNKGTKKDTAGKYPQARPVEQFAEAAAEDEGDQQETTADEKAAKGKETWIQVNFA